MEEANAFLSEKLGVPFIHILDEVDGETVQMKGHIISVEDNIVSLEYDNKGVFPMTVEDVLSDYIGRFLSFEDDEVED